MKNYKGSVLIWAIVIILIFSVFAAAALTITYSMVQRSFDNNTNRQLYLTARSASSLVASEIVSTKGSTLVNELVAKKTNVQTTANFFPSDKNMGSCTLKAVCNTDSNEIIVTAVAENAGLKQIVSAVIEKNATTNLWEIVQYDDKDINAER